MAIGKEKDGCYLEENSEIRFLLFWIRIILFLSYVAAIGLSSLVGSVKCLLEEKDITGKKISLLAANQTCVFLFKYSGNLEVNT